MKAISLWEPWASLIRTGAKKWETRHWRTPYRGPLLICAAKRKRIGGVRRLLADASFQIGLMPLLGGTLNLRPEFLPPSPRIKIEHLHFGMAVAIVDLVDCRPTYDMTGGEIGTDARYGNFSVGRYAWQLANLKAIDPFPVKGRQRFFNVEVPK